MVRALLSRSTPSRRSQRRRPSHPRLTSAALALQAGLADRRAGRAAAGRPAPVRLAGRLPRSEESHPCVASSLPTRACPREESILLELTGCPLLRILGITDWRAHPPGSLLRSLSSFGGSMSALSPSKLGQLVSSRLVRRRPRDGLSYLTRPLEKRSGTASVQEPVAVAISQKGQSP